MSDLHFDVTCLKCGSDVELVTSGIAAGTESKCICKCVKCHREWIISVYLRPSITPVAERRRVLRSRTKTDKSLQEKAS